MASNLTTIFDKRCVHSAHIIRLGMYWCGRGYPNCNREKCPEYKPVGMTYTTSTSTENEKD